MSNFNNPNTIFNKADDGDSAIYVGIKYLVIVATQINDVRVSEKLALTFLDELHLVGWLNELKIFWDLVENRTGLDYSETEIDFYKFDHDWKKIPIKIKEKEKYSTWFKLIESMIEKSAGGIETPSVNRFTNPKYKFQKEIVLELSECMRNLFRDANKRHLIMPQGQENVKDAVRREWIDRDKKKNLYGLKIQSDPDGDYEE